MSVLDRLACSQGRRDQIPNQDLARQLAESADTQGIAEIARNLWNPNKSIQSDCLKVLYEIGSIKPELITDYVEDFIKLLGSRNNRLVWGGMTALSTIAPLRAAWLCGHVEAITSAMAGGSVITRDQGVKVLAALATSAAPCGTRAFSHLLSHLETCRPKEVPQHAESTLPAVGGDRTRTFLDVVEKRLPGLSASQARRVRRVIREASGRAQQG
jgi:hypothetical protein